MGVYDADGTLLGELGYVVGHLLGRRSCALCDITHGSLKRRPEFDAAAATLDVPFDLLHRDERSPELVALTDGALPCVVAEGDGERSSRCNRSNGTSRVAAAASNSGRRFRLPWVMSHSAQLRRPRR